MTKYGITFASCSTVTPVDLEFEMKGISNTALILAKHFTLLYCSMCSSE